MFPLRNGLTTARLLGAAAAIAATTAAPARAAAGDDAPSLAAPGPARRTVTTVVVWAEAGAAARRAEVLAALEEALSTRPGIELRALATLIGEESARWEKARKEANARCVTARALLDELDIERALPDLQACVAELEVLVGLASVNEELYEAQKALGLAAFLNGDERLAAAALRQALVLVPDVDRLDSKAFPKKMKPLVDELLLNFELDRGTAEILVEPAGAEVYLNGVLAGTAPVKLEGLYYGRNYLTIRATGWLPYVGVLRVDAPALAPLRLSLPDPPVNIGGELEVLRESVGDLVVPKGATGLRKKLGVDRLVVAVVRPADEGALIVVIHAYDLHAGKRTASGTVTLAAGDHAAIGPAVEGLALDLAPTDVPVEKKKPSGPGPLAKMGSGLAKLGRSPIFWVSLGGAAAVGVGVAIVVIVASGARPPGGGSFVAGL